MTDRGYIRLHRSIWTHPVLQDDEPMTRAEAWAWLVSRAAFAPHHGLERGQVRVSLAELAKAWRWPNRRKARTFVERLEREGMITRDGSLVTVENYDRYQSDSGPDCSHSARTPLAQRSHTARTPLAHLDPDEYGVSEPPSHSARTPLAQRSHTSRTALAHTKNEWEKEGDNTSPPTPPRASGRPDSRPAVRQVGEGGSLPGFSRGLMAGLGECRVTPAQDGCPARLWLTFDARPPTAVLEALRAGGWVYDREHQEWLAERTAASEHLAEHAFGVPVGAPRWRQSTEPTTNDGDRYDDIASPSDFAPGELESLIPFGRRSSA